MIILCESFDYGAKSSPRRPLAPFGTAAAHVAYINERVMTDVPLWPSLIDILTLRMFSFALLSPKFHWFGKFA